MEIYDNAMYGASLLVLWVSLHHHFTNHGNCNEVLAPCGSRVQVLHSKRLFIGITFPLIRRRGVPIVL